MIAAGDPPVCPMPDANLCSGGGRGGDVHRGAGDEPQAACDERHLRPSQTSPPWTAARRNQLSLRSVARLILER